MSTLVTFPGRAGDLFWACAAIRSLSESIGEPVDLQIASEFASLVPLLSQQPYIDCVHAQEDWGMSQGWEPPPTLAWARQHDNVYHLGYRRWPEVPLPMEVYHTLTAGDYWLPLRALDLQRPWITVPARNYWALDVACGWSDCHFELKFGLMELIFPSGELTYPHYGWRALGVVPEGSRWQTEGGYGSSTWVEAAQAIAGAKVFLGDCSALHVLAVALGKPVILMEPMEARWNGIFYPLGKTGPVHLVRGLDGRPTFDARHVADALKEALAHAR